MHSIVAQEPQHVTVKVDAGAFTPQVEQSFTVTAPGVTATIRGKSPFRVNWKVDGAEKTASLPADIAQITMAQVFDKERLVVAGMVNGDAEMVALVNLKSGQIDDKFLCYSPGISPNGRYVAFVKFFPTHGITSAEDHYMVYDVALSPTENRPEIPKPHPWAVGRAVYPPNSKNIPDDNIDISGRPLHKMASDGFFWAPDSTQFIFLDRADNDYTVVAVRTEPSIAAYDSEVSFSSMCPPESTVCNERLSRVRFGPAAGSASLMFRGVDGTPEREIQGEVHSIGKPVMGVSLQSR